MHPTYKEIKKYVFRGWFGPMVEYENDAWMTAHLGPCEVCQKPLMAAQDEAMKLYWRNRRGRGWVRTLWGWVTRILG